MTVPTTSGLRTTRVVLADDSDGLRLLVRTWLSAVDDLEVVAEASNGAEAIALADAHRPDVVVLDVAMPVMDGLEALTELHRRFPTLPVVMLSGFAERDVAEQAARRGAFAFIEKTGDLDPLVEAVRRAASGPAPLPHPRPAVEPRHQPTVAAVPAPPAPVEPAPPRRRPTAWAPTAAAVALALAIMAWRVTSDDARAPITFLLTIPVLVVAVRHGLLGALAAAGAASAAYSGWALATGAGTPAVDHLIRLLVFVSAAAVAGTGSDRLRRTATQRQAVSDAVVASNRQLAEANEQLSRVNAELASSNADLRQFGYVVGHDLAEPLRTMSSFARLLEERCSDRLGDDGRQYVRFVSDGADRMRALITDLRDYTRTSSAELVLQPVALDDVLQDVRTALRTGLEDRHAHLRSGPLPVVAGDRSMLGLVLQNLVSNAVKFNRSPEPTVEVDAVRDGALWHVHVRDDGIGVAPQDAERVFELFGRLHGREDYEGTGLGLAIAKRVVERHRGSIALAPREGGGTVVTLTFPVAAGWAG